LCPVGRSAEAKKLSNQELLSQCKERIEQHRKGNGTIVVRDAAGKPVPNAKIKLEQIRHEVLFGSNIFRWGKFGNPDLESAYRERFCALLNYATTGFYWSYYEPERGKPIYDYTDQLAAWAPEHHITLKGHPLVWDYTPDPKWLPRDFAEIRALSNGRVRDIVSRYKGRIDIWDVVNEPTHLGRTKTRFSEWAISIGAVPYVAEHLKVARAANPSATLLVNDYRVDQPYYEILDQLRENGKLLFDIIGIQSHMHDGMWPLAKVWEVCDQFGKLGLPIHFTETTVVSGRKEKDAWTDSTPEGEAKQAEAVPQFYSALFAHPSVQGITWWDFSDNGAWMRAPAGWLRKDMSPKPVYERLMALIKKDWWTSLEGQTNDRGEFPARAYYGIYRVTTTGPERAPIQKEISWRRNQPNRIELVL
jgi:GH35 family endo-1,4-beta-xylanase